MGTFIAQFLSGLAGAASLFLVASGLSIIFGVTRIVNFAHGAFYMLGAYAACILANTLSGALGFWFSILASVLIVAVLGALLEMTLLRRIYRAPELFQLLATFGVTLVVEDLVVILFGPDDLLGPRAPGLEGAVTIAGHAIPTYDLFLIAISPIVLGLLWLLFNRTRWGILVRAATQDRDMVAALGVNQKWLFTSVFMLGVGLAAFGGALQIPRDAVTHQMDLSIIVEAFIVVVTGGLGSVFGALIAAVLISELNAFGILAFPKISIVLIFLVMAVVLVVRPWGLLGRPTGPARATLGLSIRPWRPMVPSRRLAVAGLVVLAGLLPVVAGPYVLSVGSEILIFVLYAASLQFLISTGGLVSFGHAAYFGLGCYGAALLATALGWPMETALLAGPLLGLAGAVVFGWFAVRLSGVYLAMLTLAFAQICWSVASQWVDVTGGDNGILGVWPSAWASKPWAFYELALAVAACGVALLRVATFAPFGFALRAVRDSELRAEAIGIRRSRVQWAAFVLAGLLAGISGALFAYLKGSVFPDAFGVSTSVDGLVMVLLGGMGSVSGAVAGAGVYKALSIWLISVTDYSKLVLGLLIVACVVLLPRGIAGIRDLLPRSLFARGTAR
ncbi:ABC transporter permease [Labrys monachus]|uniref:Branched-chain amino acid transport system permease protein n=1 Tax=Labrys monachus TaxID=217067 RepID=A0ABU0FDR8_9HYPH|nr:ABC transporter permease [Labrys monachus]MDQ0392754.1 branched-chain amino acid transport system permease protein [Labrys monachus]